MKLQIRSNCAEIVSALRRQLESEVGRGFGRRNLFRMIRFAEVFPDPEIVSALLTQLGWTHFMSIISIRRTSETRLKKLMPLLRAASLLLPHLVEKL